MEMVLKDVLGRVEAGWGTRVGDALNADEKQWRREGFCQLSRFDLGAPSHWTGPEVLFSDRYVA